MTKEQIFEQGIRADADLGNNLFYCESCGKTWRSKQWIDSKCDCGKTGEYHYIEHIEEYMNPLLNSQEPQEELNICTDDPILKQMRTECKSKVTTKQRHLFQCDTCKSVHVQNDYEQTIECECGNLKVIRYSYIQTAEGKTKEYYSYGPEVGQQIEQGNLVKQVRLSLRLSQRELADMLGFKRQFLSQLEQGTRAIPQSVMDKLTQLYFE